MIEVKLPDGSFLVVDMEFLLPADETLLLQQCHRDEPGRLRGIFEQMREAEQAALQRATPEQLAVSWGGYFRREFTMPDDGRQITIYGQVMHRAHIRNRELLAGAGAAEADQLLARLDAGYARGWRYGRCRSVVCPEGELGCTHVADMTPIDRMEYWTAVRDILDNR